MRAFRRERRRTRRSCARRRTVFDAARARLVPFGRRARRRLRAGRARRRMPWTSPTGTRMPVLSFWTASATPPTSVATIGFPTAIASRTDHRQSLGSARETNDVSRLENIRNIGARARQANDRSLAHERLHVLEFRATPDDDTSHSRLASVRQLNRADEHSRILFRAKSRDEDRQESVAFHAKSRSHRRRRCGGHDLGDAVLRLFEFDPSGSRASGVSELCRWLMAIAQSTRGPTIRARASRCRALGVPGPTLKCSVVTWGEPTFRAIR